MSEYMSLVERKAGGEQVAVVFFGAVLLLISLVLFLLVRYAEREGLFVADLAEEQAEDNRVKYQLLPSLTFYGVAIVCGFFWPYLAVVLYVLIGVFLLLPVRTLMRWLRRGRVIRALARRGDRRRVLRFPALPLTHLLGSGWQDLPLPLSLPFDTPNISPNRSSWPAGT